MVIRVNENDNFFEVEMELAWIMRYPKTIG